MATRGYDMSSRARAVEAARGQALSAAYELLADPKSSELSVDAVARAAGVTRATLYNQFGSRAELLVAIFRELGQRMKAERIHAAMRLPDPELALEATLRESTRAYARQRAVIEKLLALAPFDGELNAEIERSERQRRQSLAHLAGRLVAAGHTPCSVSDATELLASLTSFRAFEAFVFDAGPRLAERRLLQLLRAGLNFSMQKGKVE